MNFQPTTINSTKYSIDNTPVFIKFILNTYGFGVSLAIKIITNY